MTLNLDNHFEHAFTRALFNGGFIESPCLEHFFAVHDYGDIKGKTLLDFVVSIKHSVHRLGSTRNSDGSWHTTAWSSNKPEEATV